MLVMESLGSQHRSHIKVGGGWRRAGSAAKSTFLAEDLGSIPSTHTTIHNASSRASAGMVHIHAYR